MTVRRALCLFAVVALLAVLTWAQEPVKPPVIPRIMTSTRQVTVFSGLELQILQAIQKKDKPALESLLSDDFSIYMPDAEPLDVDEWLDMVTGKDYILKTFAVRRFFATDLGDSVQVVFERSQVGAWKGRPDSGQFFVIDLWKKSGDSWKLANRSVAKTSSVPATVKAVHKPAGKQ
jgi:hypothetical protein